MSLNVLHDKDFTVGTKKAVCFISIEGQKKTTLTFRRSKFRLIEEWATEKTNDTRPKKRKQNRETAFRCPKDLTPTLASDEAKMSTL